MPTPTDNQAVPERARACMTVDWEDFGQLFSWYEFRTIPEPLRDIERQTDLILELLDRTGVRATFFVLGMLAERRPDLLRTIHARGHEIAIHGGNHVPLTQMDADAACADISDAIKQVSDAIGGPVHGFRAPAFSITRKNLHVLDILAGLGIEYDSSIFPKALPRYGIDGFDPEPRHYELPGGGRIVELPLTVLAWAGVDWPVSGGGYLRLTPRFLLGPMAERLRRLNRRLILYTHPYEFDSEPLDVGSNFPPGHAFPAWKRRLLNLKWNLFRRSFLDKTRFLLETMHFTTCKEAADEVRRNQCTRILG